MWYGFGMGFPFFPFLWILFWIFVVYLLWGHHHRSHHHDEHEHVEDTQSAEDILSERFAKGEIDEKEYEKRLDVLRKHAEQK